MSIFEAQLWCTAAGIICMAIGAGIGYWIGHERGKLEGRDYMADYAFNAALETVGFMREEFEKNYQPKPMRDKKGKFTSPLKQKQAVIHASLEREVAAKKGRLL